MIPLCGEPRGLRSPIDNAEIKPSAELIPARTARTSFFLPSLSLFPFFFFFSFAKHIISTSTRISKSPAHLQPSCRRCCSQRARTMLASPRHSRPFLSFALIDPRSPQVEPDAEIRHNRSGSAQHEHVAAGIRAEGREQDAGVRRGEQRGFPSTAGGFQVGIGSDRSADEDGLAEWPFVSQTCSITVKSQNRPSSSRSTLKPPSLPLFLGGRGGRADEASETWPGRGFAKSQTISLSHERA